MLYYKELSSKYMFIFIVFKSVKKVKKMKYKGKNLKVEIISCTCLIIDLIAYFSLNKIVNIILLFLTFMSVALFLTYIFGLLFDKNEKKLKYIDKILGLTLIIHILIIGILLGRICYCGSHYFYVIPLIIYEIVEIILYHVFVVNYKKEKDMKYFLICFLASNILFIIVTLLSKINMEKLHNNLYKL